MLDGKDPRTEAVFQASGLTDAILNGAKRMTLRGQMARLAMLPAFRDRCDRLLTLNKQQFGDRAFVRDAVESLYNACATIANFQVKNEYTSTIGKCPCCDHEIVGAPKSPDENYCSTCLGPIREPLAKLDSSDGFGTCWI